MKNIPKPLEDLIESFKLLPGIGGKTAERLAFSILDMEEEEVMFLKESIYEAKTKIKFCCTCGYICEQDECMICLDKTRDNTICVVENSKTALLFEKNNIYRGKYHVLNGLISPIDGIDPDSININSLIERVKNEPINEIIFALKPGIEGETTSLYISKILNNLNIKFSKVAQGLPIGADIEYIDSLTLEMAIKDRKIIE